MALSEDLSRLSARAKDAEDRVAKAKAEARDRLEQDVANARRRTQEAADRMKAAQATRRPRTPTRAATRSSSRGTSTSRRPAPGSTPARPSTTPRSPSTTPRPRRTTPSSRSTSRTTRSRRRSTPCSTPCSRAWTPRRRRPRSPADGPDRIAGGGPSARHQRTGPGRRDQGITGDNHRVAVKGLRRPRPARARHGRHGRGARTPRRRPARGRAPADDDLRAGHARAEVPRDQGSAFTGVDRGLPRDGVDDAVALHDADVGVSVDTATDVAKDAADIVPLDKDLDILAGGMSEGRRIFTNTMKYVLMGTSSNFGNMFSAAAGSFFLSFLPMLPTQILLNNLLYDVSEMTIPTDNVDEEAACVVPRTGTPVKSGGSRCSSARSARSSTAVRRPAARAARGTHPLPRRLSSSSPSRRRASPSSPSAPRRVPFFRSRRAFPCTARLAVVAVAVWLPFSPLAGALGFTPLPAPFLAVIAVTIPGYLVLLEVGKRLFFVAAAARRAQAGGRYGAPFRHHRIHRRASRWSTDRPLRTSAG